MSLSENLTKLDGVLAVEKPNLVDSLKKVMSGKKQSKKVSSMYVGALSKILQSTKATISKDELIGLLLSIYGYDMTTVTKIGTEIERLKALVAVGKAEGFKVSKKKSSVALSKRINGWNLWLRFRYSPKSGKNDIAAALWCKAAPDQVSLVKILQSPVVKELAKDDCKLVARWIDLSAKKKKKALKKKWTAADLQQKTGDLYKDLLGAISIDSEMKPYKSESIFDTLRVALWKKAKGESATCLEVSTSIKKKKKVRRTVCFELSTKDVSVESWKGVKQKLAAVADLVKLPAKEAAAK